VDLLYNISMLWICCGFVADLLWTSCTTFRCCGFVVDLLGTCCGQVVQHFNLLWICCGFVVDLLWTCCTTFQLVVDLLWTCWRLSTCCTHLDTSRCCGVVVQLVVQQIHNKLNKWSLTFRPTSSVLCAFCAHDTIIGTSKTDRLAAKANRPMYNVS